MLASTASAVVPKSSDLLLPLIVWLVLVMAGKGGFIHLLLLNGLVVWIVDLVSVYRGQMQERSG